MSGPDVPAGWYDDGHGAQRWFDGTEWTDTAVPNDPSEEPTTAPATPSPGSLTPPPPPPPPYVPPAAPPPPPPPPPAAGSPVTGAAQIPEPSPAPARRRRGRRVLGVAAAVVVLGAAAGLTYSAVGDPGSTPATSPSAAPSAAGPTPVGSGTPSVAGSATPSVSESATSGNAVAGLLTDEDWSVQTFEISAADDGTFGGEAEIRYDGADAVGGQASFTFTVTKNERVVGTAIATVLDAQPGGTTTVRLVSRDRFVEGPYDDVAFAKDF